MARTQTPAVDGENDAELAQRFAGHRKSITGVSAKIIILPPAPLPRTTHKAKHIEDRRQNVWSA